MDKMNVVGILVEGSRLRATVSSGRCDKVKARVSRSVVSITVKVYPVVTFRPLWNLKLGPVPINQRLL